MKNVEITTEKINKAVSKVRSSIAYIARTANTRQEAVSRMVDVLPNDIKVGHGSSHIWISNQQGERLSLITFQD